MIALSMRIFLSYLIFNLQVFVVETINKRDFCKQVSFSIIQLISTNIIIDQQSSRSALLIFSATQRVTYSKTRDTFFLNF